MGTTKKFPACPALDITYISNPDGARSPDEKKQTLPHRDYSSIIISHRSLTCCSGKPLNYRYVVVVLKNVLHCCV